MDEYEFDTLEEGFEMLYDYSTNGAEYSIVQGAVYDNIRQSDHVSGKDAAQVSRLLNKGEIEQAENMVNELLENDEVDS